MRNNKRFFMFKKMIPMALLLMAACTPSPHAASGKMMGCHAKAACASHCEGCKSSSGEHCQMKQCKCHGAMKNDAMKMAH
jgi:hypothetical protein